MTRYVIGPDVAIRLAHDETVIRDDHQLLAPTLLRSQMLSLLYQAVRRGEMTRKDAERQLNYVRGLRIRLLGDRVLQNVAWKAAVVLGWPDGLAAEDVAKVLHRPSPAEQRRVAGVLGAQVLDQGHVAVEVERADQGEQVGGLARDGGNRCDEPVVQL